MPHFISLQWLVFLFASTRSFSLAADGNDFIFFKKGVDIPGPSMSFNRSLSVGIFEFEFKTFVERALILYQDDNGGIDYIRLSIEGSRVAFSLEIGSDDPWSFTTAKEYDDFKWHKVRIERDDTHFNFILDGKIHSFKMETSPTFSSNLQLGGFPKSRVKERSDITNPEAFTLYAMPMNWRGFFLGCVRNIKYGPNEASLTPVEDIPSLRSHVTQGSCNLTLCDKRRKNYKLPGICENTGVCKATGESSAACDCRWTGYDGSTCTEDALRLILNGTYTVRYEWRSPVSLAVKQEQFTLRIKSARADSILLVANATKGIADKLKMQIKDSRFMVTSNTGDEEVDDVLRSDEIITDNEWHLVKYIRNGNTHSLIVDGNAVNLTSNKSDPSMNYHKMLYIGHEYSERNLTTELEDFIWEYQDKEVDFVKGIFESFDSEKNEYTFFPSGVVAMFNRELPGTSLPVTTVSPAMDGCTRTNRSCHAHAYCNETEASYVCICNTGYTGDGIYNCSDIDECTTPQLPCNDDAYCSNTNGSYSCRCKEGFHGDGHVNCSDVDECSQTPAPCYGQCMNTVGSYSCPCASGFTGDERHNCTDIDECAGSTVDNCGEHAQCRNTEGSFNCIKVCNPGYQDEHNNCTDINECAQGRPVCHPKAECINTEGSFTCQCREKYHGDGVYSCSPDNPCDVMPCFPGLKCFRIIKDTYSCEKCPLFFVGDGVKCKRNATKSVISKRNEMVLTNEKWTRELTDKSSQLYKTLATKLIEQLRKIYKKHHKFIYALITKFRKGSVVAEFELIFREDVEDPFNPLQEAISEGRFGNITVEMRQPAASTGSKKEKILGLNQTVFICVVSLAGVIFILAVTVVAFILVIRRNRRRHAQIYKGKNEESLDEKEPQGLLYKTSVEEANGQCI